VVKFSTFSLANYAQKLSNLLTKQAITCQYSIPLPPAYKRCPHQLSILLSVVGTDVQSRLSVFTG
jgi:hypothetical protein